MCGERIAIVTACMVRLCESFEFGIYIITISEIVNTHYVMYEAEAEFLVVPRGHKQQKYTN